MALSAQIALRRGDFLLDAGLEVADGQTVALLGPNGSGKSTLLHAIAGLAAPDAGAVSVDGRLLTRRVPGTSVVSVPPHRRGIGLLGQDPLLFPHLSALENVAFGARAQGVDAAAARRGAADTLDAVGLGGMGGRRPAALSGGQQQRVAIARALAARPRLLLLDEPMAALDVETASLLRTLLRERIRADAVTTVLVTHDVVDALVLADTVAILDAGRIADRGQTARVLGQPANRFAAALVGLNFAAGTVTAFGTVQRSDGGELVVAGLREPAGSAVALTFPPSAVLLRPASGSVPDSPSAPAGGPPPGPNAWRSTVTALEPAAGGIRVVVDGGETVALLTPSAALAAGIAPGSPVTVSVDPAAITAHRSPH